MKWRKIYVYHLASGPMVRQLNMLDITVIINIIAIILAVAVHLALF